MMDRCFDACRLDVPITANRCATSASIARLKVGHDEYRDEPRSNIVAPSCARPDSRPY